jgi:hypothetical protein
MIFFLLFREPELILILELKKNAVETSGKLTWLKESERVREFYKKVLSMHSLLKS